MGFIMKKLLDLRTTFIFTLACLLTMTTADHANCQRLQASSFRKAYCYQESVYLACSELCTGSLLLPEKYVDADCPWGNNANVLGNVLDSFCLQSITPPKCSEICTDPQTTASRALGWKCCKACVDVCNDAPSRDSNFEDRYPAVYP
uniref:Uncharacterized protein n=1 Tax=Magallana gigas TaxID=29159 RepID=A0A8W8MVD6_MAGGI|nr:uncharacterized protein LOC105318934 [Crassostrea gigas]